MNCILLEGIHPEKKISELIILRRTVDVPFHPASDHFLKLSLK